MNESNWSDELLAGLYDAQLPASIPILPAYDLAARFLLPPAHTDPAGAWFDVVPLSQGRVALVVGDVVDTGVVGAATVGQVRAVMRTALADREEVGAALELAEIFAGLSMEARGTTLVVVVLEPSSRSMTYCTAGHFPPAIVDRHGTARSLEVTGSGPLGSGLSFTCAAHSLEPGEIVVLHSSGVAAVPPSRQPDSHRSSEAERVCEAVVHLTSGTGHAAATAALAAQARLQPLPSLSIELLADSTAVRKAREALVTWLEDITASPMAAMAVVHAGVELVANSVEHAHVSPLSTGRTVTVQGVLSQDGEVTVEVRDRGTWREAGTGIARGRGLAMAAGLVDHVQVNADARGTLGLLRHRLSRPVQILEGAAPCAADPVGDLEVTCPAPGTVTLSGDFGPDDVERVATDLLLASQGGTRDLIVDLSEVTYLSSAAARLLWDTARRCAARDMPSRVSFHASHSSPVRSSLELARLPYVDTADPLRGLAGSSQRRRLA